MRKRKGKKTEKIKPRWQRRIESSIVEWRKDLSSVEEFRKGMVLRSKVMDRLVRRYDIIEKGAVTVAALLRGKIQSGSLKIRGYVDSFTRVRQNNLFKNNQSQLYKE
ncbi:hypothetical protein AC249_AIPGENE24002, partial [Exaiptasia diaphana]